MRTMAVRTPLSPGGISCFEISVRRQAQEVLMVSIWMGAVPEFRKAKGTLVSVPGGGADVSCDGFSQMRSAHAGVPSKQQRAGSSSERDMRAEFTRISVWDRRSYACFGAGPPRGRPQRDGGLRPEPSGRVGDLRGGSGVLPEGWQAYLGTVRGEEPYPGRRFLLKSVLAGV